MGLTNNIVRAMRVQARTERIPLTVNMELLPVCNLNCKMCYIRTEMSVVEKMGGLLPASKWIGLAKEMLEEGTLFLLLTGGEVFLYPDFKYLYEQLYSMGFIITLNTNGTLIDENTVEWLKQYPPKCVSISLYGVSNDTYEQLCGKKGMFTRVSTAISLLKKAGIAVECKTLLNPLNIEDMQKCWDYCKEHDIAYEMATYAFPPSRKIEKEQQIRFSSEEIWKRQFECNKVMYGKENYDRHIAEAVDIYEKTKNLPGKEIYGFTCSAANSSCWINWQGHMTPCAMMNEPYELPFEEGFANAWTSLKEKSDKIRFSTKCSFCDKRSICSVCPASNYAESGKLDGCSEYHCKMMEGKLNYMLEYTRENKLLERE